MIKKVKIKNFKSIKDLSIDCKGINIFIGEPNTGKSNILEAIGLFSLPNLNSSQIDKSIKKIVRLEKTEQLFYDQQIDNPVKIETDEAKIEISFNYPSRSFLFQIFSLDNEKKHFSMTYDLYGNLSNYSPDKLFKFKSSVKFYRFISGAKFEVFEPGSLIPPDGSNLPLCIKTNKKIRDYISTLLANFGLRLNIKELENNIEILKFVDDVIISFPYSSLSDTLQRIIFYYTVIKSNKNTTLLLEEPESHSFPFYTKELAEIIALNTKRNQYFISTHNPYFLLSLLGKTKIQDLALFITYLEGYETKLKKLIDEEIEELFDYESDIFFNLNKFLPEK